MIIDLRSDTVTRPTAAMLAAMTRAPLGDDVLGDDPTVHRLEATCAERAGKDAALFVPSGTMANLLAIRCHTRLADEVLLHEDAHPFNYEAGGAAAFAGVQLRTLRGARGMFGPDDVRGALRAPDPHVAPASLVCVEDTTNRGGGAVWPLAQLDAVGAAGHEHGLATHLDGARVFDAVVASGVPLARRAAAWDTVAFCFSKGLGAPVGSVLCGPAPVIHLARRMRKLLGGGMRQAGVLAAAGLYALEHHVARLGDAHAQAAALAGRLGDGGFDVEPFETNMVYVQVDDGPAWERALGELGVRCFHTGPTRLRLVFHLDVPDGAVVAVATAFAAIRDQRATTSSGA